MVGNCIIELVLLVGSLELLREEKVRLDDFTRQSQPRPKML